MKNLPRALVAISLATIGSIRVYAAESEDHFAPGERVLESFGWQPGASCRFEDAVGVVLHSDWQRRHWIKLDGKQVELNGEVEMSDPGWYQTFRADGFAVTIRLRRTGDRGDGVPMVGQIVVQRGDRSKTYEVRGACGA